MREVTIINGNEVVWINDIMYIYDEVDGIVEVYKDAEMLGTISISDGDWELIKEGADPIEDGWEDGIGNTLSYEGWGEED